jgi:hypothetical protein
MDPIEILATIGVLALLVKGAVDAIRRRYPTLDGGLVQVIAIILGIGIAAGLDIKGTAAVLESLGGSIGRDPHFVVDYILTGVAIAFGAGALAEAVGRSANPPVAIVEVDATGDRL